MRNIYVCYGTAYEWVGEVFSILGAIKALVVSSYKTETVELIFIVMEFHSKTISSLHSSRLVIHFNTRLSNVGVPCQVEPF